MISFLLLIVSARRLAVTKSGVCRFRVRWSKVAKVLLTARATKALRRNRRSYPAGPARNLLRLSLLVPIIATLDAAAFAGSIIWLLRDKFRLTGSRGEDDARE